jgi:sulfur-oxidizing protein SoxA
MQRDDMQNPGMLWVQDGEALWNAKAGARDQSLRELPWRRGHEHARRRGALSGVRRAQGMPLTLGQRIDTCRQKHQGGTALAPESRAC